MFTSKLHNLCQKLRWPGPAYADRCEGPDHAPTFHATVAVGRAVFRSPAAPGPRTRNQVRDLAARAAFEVLAGWEAPPRLQILPETQVPYKWQLQDYAQKRQKDLPLYHTIQSGPLHQPMFRSTVTIDGRTFENPQDHNTKKKAESAAAAAALMALADQAKPREKMLLNQELRRRQQQLWHMLLVPNAVSQSQLTGSRSTDAILKWCYQMGRPYSPLATMSGWL
ncbi:double-stranded RNA-binding protein 1 [Triticum aestivum]|uniref:double-stranded RNA-binding protein 1 n=1 Tax=Triticum aestivum TaxID=4565 RepID=UPI001D02D886|nr:double-stranded RNA-binding protein 1-like [Triticum aestivum]